MAAVVLAGWKGGMAQARGAGDFAGLPAAFARIEASLGGRLGVSVLDTGSGQRASHRQDERFPMCSTFKLLAAGAVLARADAGQDSLERRIVFGRQDLIPWSPVTETQVGSAGMTLAALCEAAMILSDNTAANLLLGALGGPSGLTAYLRGLGDSVTRLDRTEPSLNEALAGDPRDTTSPAAFLSALQALALGSALSENSRRRLQGWLRGNKTGDNRLRARLPQGWQAGEKTGTGANGTSNDAGLLWPPGGAAPILVTAFLTGGAAKAEARDAALAEIGAAVVAAWRP
jgi:beta-lactamase class A